MKENFQPSDNAEQSETSKQDATAEERFIALYKELTGASESQARSVYMYSEIIRQQTPDCYHLE